jgi:hypothetical protein
MTDHHRTIIVNLCPIPGCWEWIPEDAYMAHLSEVHREVWRYPKDRAEKINGRIRRPRRVVMVSGGRC